MFQFLDWDSALTLLAPSMRLFVAGIFLACGIFLFSYGYREKKRRSIKEGRSIDRLGKDGKYSSSKRTD